MALAVYMEIFCLEKGCGKVGGDGGEGRGEGCKGWVLLMTQLFLLSPSLTIDWVCLLLLTKSSDVI